MTTHVLGVRHHSPACARLVAETIEFVKPRWILIEGPADMNGRLGELALAHEPPVALFSFFFSDDRRHSAWYPFCVHSPEWIALRLGFEIGAEVRFIDLPGWAVDEREDEAMENRYADRRGPVEYVGRLERETGEHGYDAIWDGCFELPPAADLARRLEVYFDGLREVEPASAADAQRERFMSDYVAWASGQGGDVLVVCGGFHAPVLRAAAERSVANEPAAPSAAGAQRAATWLVPYSQKRLDSFAGYASGLPSPAWYRWSWEHDDPGRRALESTATRLRKRGVGVSVADTLAAWTQAVTLSHLRGHSMVGRVDVLDAVASTWIKEALDGPLPWSARQMLHPSTHPVLVELVAALSGELRGRLAPDTPLPPLTGHVSQLLRELDLEPPDAGSRTVSFYPGEEESRVHRVTLERLVLLRISGFARVSDPVAAPQVFSLTRDENFESSLIEAASYGPDLEAAAIAALEERAADSDGLLPLVDLLVASIRAGLPGLSSRAIAELRRIVGSESHLDVLGRGVSALVGLFRHGGLNPADRAAAVELLDGALDRGLWLVEGIRGAGPLSLGRVSAVVAFRDTALQAGEELSVTSARIEGVWQRVATSNDVPADLKGAALGALVSLGYLQLSDATRVATRSIKTAGAKELGDYLTGLLTVAREVVSADEAILRGLDESIARLDPTEFHIALPSLRLAFHRLPVRERATVAERLVAIRGGGDAAVLTRRLDISPEDVARARQVAAAANALKAELGLDD